jgi:Family of unknown function (DUF6328)
MATTTHERAGRPESTDIGGAPGRRESEAERLDRNLIELLNELRVATAGVQILFAFLLTVAFTQRFGEATEFQRDVYFITLMAAAISTVLLIAPSAYHRLVFHHQEKESLVKYGNLTAIAGMFVLSIAITGAVLLISSLLFQGAKPAIFAGVVALAFVIFWFLIPLIARLRSSNDDD